MQDHETATFQMQIEDESSSIDLMGSIKSKLTKISPFVHGPCIYRISEKLKNINEAAYVPRVISFGPFHHGKKSLQVMEEYKWMYLNIFLNSLGEKSLEEYVEVLRGLEGRARACYAENINYLDSDQFVKMMLLDGCFIILFLLAIDDPNQFQRPDPIFNTRMVGDIYWDIILLENQLPFFVLEDLFSLTTGTNHSHQRFLELIHRHFYSITKKNEISSTLISSSSSSTSDPVIIEHFVDFILSYFRPSSPRVPPVKWEGVDEFLPSVTQLHEAGVKFKASSSNCLFDISFKNGVLKIPTLHVMGSTDTLFRNLLAFEQYRGSTAFLVEYMALMDKLINTPKDIGLLAQYGIIVKSRDDEDVSNLFNKFPRETFHDWDNFYFAKLFEDLNAHYRTQCNVWKATLRRDYFQTPWAIVSFCAAVVFLLLTLIQTIASVIQL